jgi:hypothetical protein
MLIETHRRIARAIAKTLNLTEREAKLLEAGSVAPDQWENFPHHSEKETSIARRILEARRRFIHGDDECYHDLGVALHYIEDKWTTRLRPMDKHTQWEASINEQFIIDDRELREEISKTVLPTKVEQNYLKLLDDMAKDIAGQVLDWRSIRVPTYRRSSTNKMRAGYFRGSSYYSAVARARRRSSDDSQIGQIARPTIVPSGTSEYGAKVINYALQDRPTAWSSPAIDLNFAYRVCLRVARTTLSLEEDKDDWTPA